MQNVNDRSRQTALEEICKVSFVIDELRLYLDTHPGCGEALTMIKEYMYQRKVLMEEFTEKYGSLEAYWVGDCDGWIWNDPPMPWDNYEGGRCHVGV